MGELERPVSMCMKAENSGAGRKLLHVDRNLDRLIWRWDVLEGREGKGERGKEREGE